MNTLLIVLQQQSNGLMNFLPLILIIVVFWFFMIRPQMKRQKELKNFRDSLKKGDKIVTTGGIYGKVLEIGDYYIIMEVEGQNRPTLLRQNKSPDRRPERLADLCSDRITDQRFQYCQSSSPVCL